MPCSKTTSSSLSSFQRLIRVSTFGTPTTAGYHKLIPIHRSTCLSTRSRMRPCFDVIFQSINRPFRNKTVVIRRRPWVIMQNTTSKNQVSLSCGKPTTGPVSRLHIHTWGLSSGKEGHLHLRKVCEDSDGEV